MPDLSKEAAKAVQAWKENNAKKEKENQVLKKRFDNDLGKKLMVFSKVEFKRTTTLIEQTKAHGKKFDNSIVNNPSEITLDNWIEDKKGKFALDGQKKVSVSGPTLKKEASIDAQKLQSQLDAGMVEGNYMTLLRFAAKMQDKGIRLDLILKHSPDILEEFSKVSQGDALLRYENGRPVYLTQESVLRRCVAFTDFAEKGLAVDKNCLKNLDFIKELKQFSSLAGMGNELTRQKVNQSFAIAQPYKDLEGFLRVYKKAYSDYKETALQELKRNADVAQESLDKGGLNPNSIEVLNSQIAKYKRELDVNEKLKQEYNPDLKVAQLMGKEIEVAPAKKTIIAQEVKPVIEPVKVQAVAQAPVRKGPPPIPVSVKAEPAVPVAPLMSPKKAEESKAPVAPPPAPPMSPKKAEENKAPVAPPPAPPMSPKKAEENKAPVAPPAPPAPPTSANKTDSKPILLASANFADQLRTQGNKLKKPNVAPELKKTKAGIIDIAMEERRKHFRPSSPSSKSTAWTDSEPGTPTSKGSRGH